MEHFDGVAIVEMEDFVGVEDVHFRECPGLEQVVNGGARGANSAGKVEGGGGRVRAAE